MKISIVCQGCGNTYQKERKHINQAAKKGWNLYCSRKCQSSSIEIPCFTCRETVLKTPATIRRSKSGRIYCSRSCATIQNNKDHKSGSGHPSFVDGKSAYRKTAKRIYTARCVICDYDIESVLEVHHIDGDRSNNDPKNLVWLCPTHHKECTVGLRTIIRI